MYPRFISMSTVLASVIFFGACTVVVGIHNVVTFVYALGPSRRSADAANANAYRASANHPLELFHTAEGDQELLLSNKTAERLLGELADGYKDGLKLIGLGLFIIAVAYA